MDTDTRAQRRLERLVHGSLSRLTKRRGACRFLSRNGDRRRVLCARDRWCKAGSYPTTPVPVQGTAPDPDSTAALPDGRIVHMHGSSVHRTGVGPLDSDRSVHACDGGSGAAALRGSPSPGADTECLPETNRRMADERRTARPPIRLSLIRLPGTSGVAPFMGPVSPKRTRDPWGMWYPRFRGSIACHPWGCCNYARISSCAPTLHAAAGGLDTASRHDYPSDVC